MIRDTFTTFASAVTSTSAAAHQFGDVIDLEAMGADTNVGSLVGGQRDVGTGQPVRVYATVNTPYVSTGFADTFTVVTSDNANLTTPVTLITSSAFTSTDFLVAGSVLFDAVLPTEGSAYKRYLGILETSSGTVTSGKVDIGLVLDDRTKPEKSYVEGSVGF